MNALGIALVWCVAQVTLLALLCGGLYLIVRRLRPAAAAPVALTGLVTVVLLSALALAPWPQWPLAGVGPRASVQRSEGLEASASMTRQDPRNSLDGLSPPRPSYADSGASGDGLSRAASWWRTLLGQLSPGQPIVPDAAWRWPAFAGALVLTGMAAGMGWLLLGLLAVRSQRGRSRPVEDAALLVLVDTLRAELGCRRRIEVRESSDLTTAATIGWRRPVILLPCQWTAWTAEQRRAVLAHEIAHVGRNDFLAVLCGQLGLVPHFYHPLLHWLMARLRLEQELAADAAAAVVTGGQRQYLVTIAELALHQQDRPLAWPARSFLPTQTTFLRRIAMLRDARVRSDRLSPTARTLAVGAVLVCGLVVAGLRGPVGQLQSLAQEAKRAAADLESDARAKELTGIDLTYVPEDAVGILAWRPAAIFRQPGPAQYASILADVLPRAPTPITEIEQFTIVVLRAAEKKPPALPDALAIYQTLKPYDFQAVLRRMHKAARKEYEGKVYYVEIMGTPPGFVLGNVVCQLDDRTLVQGSSEETLKKLISGRKGLPKFIDAKVWKAFEPDHAVVAVEASTVAQIVRMTQPPSAAALLSTFSPLWQDSTCGVGGLRVGRELKVHAVAVVTSKTQFRNVSKTVDALLTSCSNAAREARAAASHEKKAEHEASSVLVLEVVARIFANMHIQTEADNVISVEGSVSMDTIRNLLPPITDARRASDRTRSVNNLKHIAIAMHNYHDKYKCFPPAVLYGPDGKTPYSWRVAILPFLEQAALYKHYRFDEPWDGPNNRRLAEIRVPVFHCPSEIARSANASYFALVGPGTVFEKKDRAKPSGVPKSPVAGSPGPRIETDGISFTEIRDGTSNTLMIVEAKRNIPWSKPEDIPYDPKKPIPELGGYFEGGFHAARCDGAVFFLPNSIAEATLRAMISRNGREVIDWRKEVGKR